MSEITLSYSHAPIHTLLRYTSGLGSHNPIAPAPGLLVKCLLQRIAGTITFVFRHNAM